MLAWPIFKLLQTEFYQCFLYYRIFDFKPGEEFHGFFVANVVKIS